MLSIFFEALGLVAIFAILYMALVVGGTLA